MVGCCVGRGSASGGEELRPLVSFWFNGGFVLVWRVVVRKLPNGFFVDEGDEVGERILLSNFLPLFWSF